MDVSQTYAIRIAGSEESLTRLAEKYIAKGYRVRSGNLLEALRALLRRELRSAAVTEGLLIRPTK